MPITAKERTEALQALSDAAIAAGIDPGDVVLPRSHHTVVDGMRFHYLAWEGPYPPAVLLHGGGLNAHTWDLTCLGLRKRCRCFAIDQRGHGDSEWSPEVDYSPAAYIRDLHSFVDARWLGEFVLIGQSLGAMNAVAYASRHPKRVLALVIVDVALRVELGGVERITRFVRGAAELRSIDDYVAHAVAFNPRRDPMRLRRSLMYNLRRLPDGGLTWKHDLRRRPLTATAIAEWMDETWSGIDRISCPVLIVRGSESDVVTDEHAIELAGRFKNGRFVRIEDAGHNVQGDNPRDLTAEVCVFLDDVLPREA